MHYDDIFSVKVSVFDDFEMNSLCGNCYFNITISIDNNGIFYGNNYALAFNGIANFEELQIQTLGDYKFHVQSERAISCESLFFSIGKYYMFLNVVTQYKVIFNKILNTKSTFDVDVLIYDNSSYTSLHKTGTFIITLNFSNIKISQAGDYKLYVLGDGLIPKYSDTLSIKDSNFSWFYTINHGNNILIQFDRELPQPLTFEDFSFSNKKSIKIDFELHTIYLPVYNFTVVILETIPKNTEISVEIKKKNLKSIDNFYFDYSTHYI